MNTPKPQAPKKSPAQPLNVRTRDGYKSTSAGLVGPANPVLTAIEGERLKVIIGAKDWN